MKQIKLWMLATILTSCGLMMLSSCSNEDWKSRVYLTPEGEVALTPENVFILTPKEPWPMGSFLFRLTCLL